MDIEPSPANLVDDEGSARHFYHYFHAYPDSFALVSPQTGVKTAVVFVHGFGGDASETWANFQLAVDDERVLGPEFAQTDLFFLGYQSVWERMGSSVDRLKSFIESLVEAPDDRHFAIPIAPLFVGDPDEETTSASLGYALPEKRAYERMVMVGHSEGGVVIRKVVLNAVTATSVSSLHSTADVVLFAPAIFGYSPSGLLGILANMPGFGAVIDAVLHASPAYQDLKDVSTFLLPLQQETEAIQAHHRGCRASILWARKDRIVRDGKGKYSGDPDPQYVDDQGHIGVCKPRDGFSRPVEFLIESMKAR